MAELLFGLKSPTAEKAFGTMFQHTKQEPKSEKKRKRFKAFKVLKFMAFGALFVAVAGFATMILWNALMPAIFGLPALELGQALGLLILARLLTGGFRGGGGWGRGGGQHHHYWKQRMADRWANMTPEEREHWKSHWGGRCGKFRDGKHSEQDAQSDLV